MLDEVLANDFGVDLTGWTLSLATAISDDGMTIVGNGTNPSGDSEGWVVRLPEPARAIGLALGFAFVLALRARARRSRSACRASGSAWQGRLPA